MSVVGDSGRVLRLNNSSKAFSNFETPVLYSWFYLTKYIF